MKKTNKNLLSESDVTDNLYVEGVCKRGHKYCKRSGRLKTVLNAEQNKLRRKKKRITGLAVVLVLLVFIFGCAFTWFGWASRVVKDTFLVAIDYIDLDHPLEKVNYKDIMEVTAEANNTQSHPYVLVTAEDFEEIKSEYYADDGDAYIKDRMTYALLRADEMISDSLLVYELNEDGEMLEVSRNAVDRIMTLAGAWQITGQNKYALRAWQEIENVCNFSDWHDDHFLDTTEMSFAVSLGYDWLYDYLSTEQKDFIAQKVYDYGIAKANPTTTIFKNWWLWSKVNWNTQCYGGIGVASMVFSDYYPKQTAKFLSAAYYNMPLHFSSFSPDGSYVEGNSYWEAMSSYLIYFISTSRNFLDTDYGLSTLAGFDKIGYFPLTISAPQGVFNTGDNRNLPLYAPSLHWFAEEYNEPMLSYFQTMSVKENEYARESMLSCLWYNPNADFSDEALAAVPLSEHMKSDIGEEFVTMRSAYCDPSATYVGIKGGYNYTNHGDLDIGSFVFDALGERWVHDLGKSSYSSPGYFVGLVGGGRWRVYTKRAEGHNTLVINPELANEDQYPFAKVVFKDFQAVDGGGTGTLDMTDAYIRNKVKCVTRKIEMFDNYKYFTLTDTVSCKTESDIWWFAHVDAKIQIIDDGKTAVLTKTSTEDGVEIVKRVYVRIGNETDGTFEVMKSLPLSESERFEDNKEIEGIHKLAIHLSNVTDAKIVVTFKPEY